MQNNEFSLAESAIVDNAKVALVGTAYYIEFEGVNHHLPSISPRSHTEFEYLFAVYCIGHLGFPTHVFSVFWQASSGQLSFQGGAHDQYVSIANPDYPSKILTFAKLVTGW